MSLDRIKGKCGNHHNAIISLRTTHCAYWWATYANLFLLALFLFTWQHYALWVIPWSKVCRSADLRKVFIKSSKRLWDFVWLCIFQYYSGTQLNLHIAVRHVTQSHSLFSIVDSLLVFPFNLSPVCTYMWEQSIANTLFYNAMRHHQ